MIIDNIRDKKLSNYITLSKTVFDYLDYDFTPIDISITEWNLLLYSNYGQRIIAPVVDVLTNYNVSLLDEDQLLELATVILQMFKRKWDSYKNTLNLEYEILNPYRMNGTKNKRGNEENSNTRTVDQETSDIGTLSGQESNSGSDSTTRGVLGKETHTTSNTRTYNSLQDQRSDNTQIANTGTVSDTGNNSNNDGIFGFNSKVSSGANDSNGSYSDLKTNNLTETHSGTDTNVRTGSYSDNGSEVITYSDGYSDEHEVSYGKRIISSNTHNNNGTLDSIITDGGEKTIEESESSHLSGNIGNHSNQELIREEIELWKKNFVNQILNDVASVLTIDVYC